MAVELLAADDWIHDVLTADPDLAGLVDGRVYVDLIRGALPAIVFSVDSPGVDTIGVGGVRIMARPTYTVKVVGQGGSFVPLRPIADRIDVLMHGNHDAAATGGIVFSGVRETPLHYTTLEEGITYRHLGGTYRLHVQAV